MGISRTVYLGVYVLAPHVAQPQRTTSYRCSRQCGQTWPSATHRFCSACGAGVEPVHHDGTKVQALLPRAIAGGKYNDDFFVPESGQGEAKTVWLPNLGGFGEFVKDTPVDLLQELDFAALTAQKDSFLQAYAELFAAVEREFGVKLEVQVGPLAYWH